MNDDWLQTQRKYWEQWTDLTRSSLGPNTATPNAWEGAMEHWWQAMAPATPAASREFVEKLMAQGKIFFRMADTFTRDLGGGDDGWQAISRTLDEIQKAFRSGDEAGDDALHKMMAFWELPYDNWQRTMSSLSPMPGDLLRNMPHEQVREGLHRFLSAPGLGYMREEQSQYQDLLRRTLDYQKALRDYLEFFSRIGVKSTNRMRETLVKLAKEGGSIDSARGIYDNWVESCEAIYTEEVQTPEYARIHGRLINADMALKQRMGVMVDEYLGSMNMPTRRELRTLQDRLQETRRETKALRHEIEAMKRHAVPGTTIRSAEGPAAPSPSPSKTPAAPMPTKKFPVSKKVVAKATTVRPRDK